MNKCSDITEILLKPVPTYNKSAADDFENIPEKNWKLPLNESTIIE